MDRTSRLQAMKQRRAVLKIVVRISNWFAIEPFPQLLLLCALAGEARAMSNAFL